MNVPNSLSIFRLLLIPVFCVTFLMGPDYYIYAGLALALSALSDLFDGYFARKLNQITDLGKLLDPVADKLTLGAVVACMWLDFHEEYPIVTPIFAVLIGKEILMAIGGLVVMRGRKKVVSSMWWGKFGTAVFYTCMIGIVLISVFGTSRLHLSESTQNTLIVIFIILPAAAMVFAFIRYFILAVRLLREKDDEPEPVTVCERCSVCDGISKLSDGSPASNVPSDKGA